jgi:hypothetical protein
MTLAPALKQAIAQTEPALRKRLLGYYQGYVRGFLGPRTEEQKLRLLCMFFCVFDEGD